MLNSFLSKALCFGGLLLLSNSVYAETLYIPEDAHFLVKVVADIVLYTHVVGGTLGLLTGLMATITPKGGVLHRHAGRAFMAAMFACYGVGALVAPFLTTGQRPNTVAALLALYLLVSGVHAAKNKHYSISKFNVLGAVFALVVTGLGLLFMWMASQNASGTVDGAPPAAFVLFVVAGSFALIGDLRIIVVKQLSNQERVYRHLWRMCFSLRRAHCLPANLKCFPNGLALRRYLCFLRCFPYWC